MKLGQLSRCRADRGTDLHASVWLIAPRHHGRALLASVCKEAAAAGPFWPRMNFTWLTRAWKLHGSLTASSDRTLQADGCRYHLCQQTKLAPGLTFSTALVVEERR